MKLNYPFRLLTIYRIIILLLLLFPSCVRIRTLQTFFFFPLLWIKGLLFEEKTRLGSTPPSCHNKCNSCHPCMAVQVPTLPRPAQPGSTRTVFFFDLSKYSNYKPLGWKCRCGNHFFNP
ncbi:hypothetical protein UlMin_038305 [Ulmus minor]